MKLCFAHVIQTLWPRLFVVALLCIAAPAVLSAQSELSEQDQKFIERMRVELSLDSAQLSAVKLHFAKADSTVRDADKHVKDLQTSSLPEEQISAKVVEWNAKKKSARESRDLDVQLLLSAEQKAIYETKLKPAKPQVLHFGMHNRADCQVCKSP